MPETKYFLKLGGLLILGLIAFAIAGILFVVLLPHILLITVGILFLILIFILIWVIVYMAVVFIVAIYYFFKPMKVSKKGKYTIKKTKEAGKRSKGKSKK